MNAASSLTCIAEHSAMFFPFTRQARAISDKRVPPHALQDPWVTIFSNASRRFAGIFSASLLRYRRLNFGIRASKPELNVCPCLFFLTFVSSRWRKSCHSSLVYFLRGFFTSKNPDLTKVCRL